MADDNQLLIGKWTVWVKDWIWEYEFFANGTVTWRDTRSLENGTGRWSMSPKLVNLSWVNSETKESWQRPLNAPRNGKTYYSSSYFVGSYQIEKVRAASPGSLSGLPVNPQIANVPWPDKYVDSYVDCKYDLNYKIPSNVSFGYSSILQLSYVDGTSIELDFSELEDQPMSSQVARDSMAQGYLGRGGLIFPKVLAPATVPRLWSARSKALADQDADFKAFANVAMTGVAFTLNVPAMPAGLPPPAGVNIGKTRVPGVPRAPAGAITIKLSSEEYIKALSHVIPGHSLNSTASLIDRIGANAASAVVKDQQFLAALARDDAKLAGTLFHSAAAREIRGLPPNSVASGWKITAERTLKSGRGGGRADVFLEGPAGEIVEIDWKTSGESAFSYKAIKQMEKHAGQIRVDGPVNLSSQESRSWVDYVRWALSE